LKPQPKVCVDGAMRNLLLVVLLGLSGCVVRVANEPVGGPAPAARQAMTQDEAISIGARDCAQRGYACALKEAHGTGDGIWKVKFAVERGDARGHLHLEYDAWSRALVRADEKVKVHGKGKHHGDDDEHEHAASAHD
jgi:hypothetical protein